MVKLVGEIPVPDPTNKLAVDGKVCLPDVDIFDPVYIHTAILTHHCSMAPDSISGVYIGAACARHDTDYDFISVQAGWWLRIRLKFQADKRLHDGVAEAFRREGLPLEGAALADVYRLMVSQFNLPFRICKVVTSIPGQIWRAITFQSC